MGRLNHHEIDNGFAEVQYSEFPVEFNFESVPYPDTTPIKSIDDDEMDHILKLFHSEHDEDLMGIDIQIIQARLLVSPPSKFYTVSTVFFINREE